MAAAARVVSAPPGWLRRRARAEETREPLQATMRVKSVGAMVRRDVSLASPKICELPDGAEVSVVEKACTADGKERARLVGPVVGWVSLKCLREVA